MSANEPFKCGSFTIKHFYDKTRQGCEQIHCWIKRTPDTQKCNYTKAEKHWCYPLVPSTLNYMAHSDPVNQSGFLAVSAIQAMESHTASCLKPGMEVCNTRFNDSLKLKSCIVSCVTFFQPFLPLLTLKKYQI